MNDYLETGISIVLILFIFSVVAYVIQELIAANLKFRSKMLEGSLLQILNSTTTRDKMGDLFFNHPQIKLLKEKMEKLPSYVPAANFAAAVIDLVSTKSDQQTENVLNNFKSGLTKFEDANGDLPVLLKTFLSESQDVKELKTNIEKWYDQYMDRVSGWYKNKYRFVTRIIAVGIVLVFNLDLIRVTETIYHDSSLKKSFVSMAESLADNPESIKSYYTSTIDSKLNKVDAEMDLLKNDSTKKMKTEEIEKLKQHKKDSIIAGYNTSQLKLAQSLIDTVSSSKLVFGWETIPLYKIDKSTGKSIGMSFKEIMIMLLGFFVAAVGISMGAPFWFEVMIKLVNVRRAGTKPKKSQGT